MSSIDKRRGKGSSSAKSNNTLSAKMFLGQDGQEAYVEPTILLEFIDNDRIEDVEEFERFINLLFEKRKFAINRRERTDLSRKLYSYQSFLNSRGPDGVKVRHIGRIKQFIADYHAGLFSIDFTFDQLVEEAENGN